MKELVIPAQLIKAAMNFQAKGDVRYYLNGVHLDNKGFINGTNGHILFRAPCDELKTLDDDLILAILGKIPASAWMAHISIPDEGNDGSMWFSCPIGKPIKKLGIREGRFFSIIDGKFPDIEKVLPEGEPVPTARFAVNASYMTLVEKAAIDLGLGRWAGITINMRGENKAVDIEINAPDHKALVVIMPCRL